MITDIRREAPEPDGILKQYALGPGELPNTTPVRFSLDFSLSVEGKSVWVFYKGTDGSNLDINVDSDSVYELVLSDKDWRWSTRLRALTTKKNHDRKYKALHYVPKDITKAPVKWTANMSGEFNTIRFAAEKQQGTPTGHGFCLNVEFKTPSNLWLPITIDPDIINPKPVGGRLAQLFGGESSGAKSYNENLGFPLFSLNDDFALEEEGAAAS